MAECVVHWFRRDLRLDDNLALEGALRTGVPVVPLFILDDRILRQPTMGERRLQFLRTALLDLDRALRGRGSRLLVVRAEDAARELNRVAEEVGAWALYFNRDYTPYARWRDTRTTRGMQMTGVVTMPMDDLLLVSPLRTIDADGHLPTDFDAFALRWFEALQLGPEGEPAEGTFMASGQLPAAVDGWPETLAPALLGPSPWPGATPASAATRLEAFLAQGLERYPAQRELAGEYTTSRLSAALKFGTVSARRLAATVIAEGARNADARPSVERFIMELARRDFAHHLLFSPPQLTQDSWDPPEGAVGGSRGGTPVIAAEEAFDAWAGGRTGVPLIDAGMRQLSTEGWMPDGVRVAAASFLSHGLGIDPASGARHFARHQVDHDVAMNATGWRQALGVGVAASSDPGIYDPRHQAESLDPGGDYVRRHVPELARVPDAFIHHPWDMPAAVQSEAACRVPMDYPKPIAAVAMPRGR
ncbi:MAG: deoxyribodipyrimidine photo-lyase [Candidatus Dormibacteria bacterium]